MSGQGGAPGRGGFTLVEVVVAIVLLTTGLLVLAGTTGAVARMMVDGQRQTETAALAQRRFEALQSVPCASVTAGSATTGPFSESWTVTSTANSTRRVVLTVTYPRYGETQTATFQTVIRCRTS